MGVVPNGGNRNESGVNVPRTADLKFTSFLATVNLTKTKSPLSIDVEFEHSHFFQDWDVLNSILKSIKWAGKS